jgi:hypothetical protein
MYWRNDVGELPGISDAAAAYSLRRLNPAYKGPVARVERADDRWALDIDDSDDMRQFCTRTTCTVRTMYDQSGNGNHIHKVD